MRPPQGSERTRAYGIGVGLSEGPRRQREVGSGAAFGSIKGGAAQSLGPNHDAHIHAARKGGSHEAARRRLELVLTVQSKTQHLARVNTSSN
jgi:hypothetical protein